MSIASPKKPRTRATPLTRLGALGVFGPNKRAPLHRWVSFTEGFSAELVTRCLQGAPRSLTVYDPFGGTGTTPLVAAQLGHRGLWSEVNPYLREVAQTKVIAAESSPAKRRRAIATLSEALLAGPTPDRHVATHPLVVANEKRDYFGVGVAEELIAWLCRFNELEDDLARRLAQLAVATAAVPCSNMKRAVDLRRRTPSELEKPQPGVGEAIRAKISAIMADLRSTGQASGSAALIANDARLPPTSLANVELVVTSPPYLNGTNYFRNTKLELLLLKLIDSEADLGVYRAKAVTAGINNVSKRIAEPTYIDLVEPLAEQLDLVAYDMRIPRMVRAYFADMSIVLTATRQVMKTDGRLVLDIGDSRFAGVHVDTPTLLIGIAEKAGWALSDVEVLRTRVAKDGEALCQKLLSLRPM
jgi:hypothetical protein